MMFDLLGNGTFGSVYKGIDVETKERVAIKIEPKLSSNTPRIPFEREIYQILNRETPSKYLPRIKWSGSFHDKYNAIVMEQLDTSLEKLFRDRGKRFSIRTIMMVWYRLIQIIENIHSKGILHRDIKPDNIMIGKSPNRSKLYLIDYGLSKVYYNTAQKQHIPPLKDKVMTGTVKFASVRNLAGHEQSRRDDLEAVFYTILYFVRGELPWDHVKVKNLEQTKRDTLVIKRSVGDERLCQDLPEVFLQIIQYIKSLSFEETPNYCLLKNWITYTMEQYQFGLEDQYDWI